MSAAFLAPPLLLLHRPRRGAPNRRPPALSAPRTRRPRPIPPPPPPTDRWSPERLGFLHVATITGAHGVRGEAKARCASDFGAYRLGAGASERCAHFLLLPGRRYPRPVGLADGRPASQPGAWILRLRGVSSREHVLALRGARIFVRETDRPRLRPGEFLVGDLVGARVTLQGGIEVIGVVESVVTRDELCDAAGSGKAGAAVAADLLEVALFDVPQGSGKFDGDIPEPAKRVLVPFVTEVVPGVDADAGSVVLDPPRGLLDIAVVNRKEKLRTPRGLLMPAKE